MSPVHEFGCHKCGAWIEYALMESESCPNCRTHSLPFCRVTSLGNYENVLRQTVIELKRPGHEAVAIQMGRWLGRRVLAAAGANGIQLVTPVPIHWSRKLCRGYHVSGLLAEGLQQLGGWQIDGEAVRCRRLTRKQGMLTTRQRFENVRNGFAVSDARRIRGKRILVVDDVMTSCATATQVAGTLLRAGAESIHLAILARGVGHH